MIKAIKVNTPRGEVRHIIETDPTGAFTHLTQQEIADSLGLIPKIMFNPANLHLNMWDALDVGYQHGGGLLVGAATISENLSYNFPGDPPLKPIAKYIRGTEVAYQYEYGLMMVEKYGELTAARMD